MTADSIEKTAQLMTCKLCRIVVERTRSGACTGWPCPARRESGNDDAEALLRVPPANVVPSGSEVAAGGPSRVEEHREHCVPGAARLFGLAPLALWDPTASPQP